MSVTVVLNKPQALVNIAVVLRAMKNFGFRELRLVSPVDFNLRRIEGVAHKTGDIAQHTQIYDSVDEALADRSMVYGFTARGRAAKRNVIHVADAAQHAAALNNDERVALLFGPEDKGLTNDDLDRCHRIVAIPARVEHSSINLAQAVTLTLYEWFRMRETPAPLKPPKRTAPPVTRDQLEHLFADTEVALEAIEFFKSRKEKSIMRTLREIAHRTTLDERETKLLRAISIEVVRFLDRVGAR